MQKRQQHRNKLSKLINLRLKKKKKILLGKHAMPNDDHRFKSLFRVLKRSHYGSLPNIHEKFLSEELDFNFSTMKKSKYKITDLIRECYFIDEDKRVRSKTKEKVQLEYVSSSLETRSGISENCNESNGFDSTDDPSSC